MRHFSFRSFLCYGIVGLVCNIFIYLLYLYISHNGIEPKMAMTFIYIIGACISFIANKKVTFNYNGNGIGLGVRYLIAHLFGYLLNFFILSIFVDRLAYSHQIVQGVAVFVVAAFLFVVFNLFVFKVNNIRFNCPRLNK